MLLEVMEDGALPVRVQTVRAMRDTVDREEIAILLTSMLDIGLGEEVVHQAADVMRIKRSISQENLLKQRYKKSTKGFKEAVVLALGYFKDRWSEEMLVKALKDKKLQALAAESLGRLGVESGLSREPIIEYLLPLLKSRSVEVQLSALWALGRWGAQEASPGMLAMMKKRKPHLLVVFLIKKLHGLDPATSPKVLLSMLEEDEAPKVLSLPEPKAESRLDFYDLETVSRSVTFVIDISLSMREDDRWGQAREALVEQVAKLEEDTLFNHDATEPAFSFSRSTPLRLDGVRLGFAFAHTESRRLGC